MSPVDEVPFWISVNGVRRIVLSCTAGSPEALAVGHLIGEGWIRGVADLHEITTHEGPGRSSGVAVVIPAELERGAEALRAHRVEHGCGLRHHLDCTGSVPAVTPAPHATDFGPALRELFACADGAAPAGGVHAAALSDGGSIAYAAVDVARHCAVDRVIGAAALADAGSRGTLVLTSRVSAAIVLKAAHARVPSIASRSIATPLARELAAAAGISIVEKAARRERPPSQ